MAVEISGMGVLNPRETLQQIAKLSVDALC